MARKKTVLERQVRAMRSDPEYIRVAKQVRATMTKEAIKKRTRQKARSASLRNKARVKQAYDPGTLMRATAGSVLGEAGARAADLYAYSSERPLRGPVTARLRKKLNNQAGNIMDDVPFWVIFQEDGKWDLSLAGLKAKKRKSPKAQIRGFVPRIDLKQPKKKR